MNISPCQERCSTESTPWKPSTGTKSTSDLCRAIPKIPGDQSNRTEGISVDRAVQFVRQDTTSSKQRNLATSKLVDRCAEQRTTTRVLRSDRSDPRAERIRERERREDDGHSPPKSRELRARGEESVPSSEDDLGGNHRDEDNDGVARLGEQWREDLRPSDPSTHRIERTVVPLTTWTRQSDEPPHGYRRHICLEGNF